MQSYIDETGVENIACAMISQARKDFIKGGKILYGIFKRIPTYFELIKDPIHATLSNNQSIRWMYDAWNFVKNDPYSMFEMGEEPIIESWSIAATTEYYRELYLNGAMILFANHVSKKDIKGNDEIIKKTITEPKIAEEFIEARNYISKLPDGEKILHEWDVIAFGRRRSIKKGQGRIPINQTEYHKKASEKKRKNIERAHELFDAGFTPKAIAEELGVTIQAARLYLRS